jgi:hypothetical protein
LVSLRISGVFALVGAGLLVAGAAFVYWPAALLLAGALVLAFGLLAETK